MYVGDLFLESVQKRFFETENDSFSEHTLIVLSRNMKRLMTPLKPVYMKRNWGLELVKAFELMAWSELDW